MLAQVLANSGQIVALNGKNTLRFAAAETSKDGVGKGLVFCAFFLKKKKPRLFPLHFRVKQNQISK